MDVLHLPLDQLAELSMQNLRSHNTLERASRSILYRENWSAAGIRAEEVENYDDFAKLPYITGPELRKGMNECPLEEVLCSKVEHWFSSTGTTGQSKWIPYGRRDIELFMETRDRLDGLLPSRDNLSALAVSAPPPFVEDGLYALNMMRMMQLNKHNFEGVTICLTHVENEDVINFALGIKPNIIIGFPSFAARLAEIIEEEAPGVAKKEFDEKKSLNTFFNYLVTRFKKIQPKDLSNFKWGLFGGEPLDPYREVLKKAYGMEPYEIYLFTEFMPPAVECRMHNGMHLWLDICLPELIPEAELVKETMDRKYVPKAIPLWQAKQGMRGEYVLTTFGEALPLVRYRFGDLIEVAGTEPCGCGSTHPRIKVPRRSDATICLGPIRFPSSQLEKKLLEKTMHGKAQRWQIEICREGYHPKAIIRLEPQYNIDDKESFLKDINSRIMEIEILRTGVKNKILSEPEVRIERLLNEGRPVTKAGSIIYRDE